MLLARSRQHGSSTRRCDRATILQLNVKSPGRSGSLQTAEARWPRRRRCQLPWAAFILFMGSATRMGASQALEYRALPGAGPLPRVPSLTDPGVTKISGGCCIGGCLFPQRCVNMAAACRRADCQACDGLQQFSPQTIDLRRTLLAEAILPYGSPHHLPTRLRRGTTHDVGRGPQVRWSG